jgi:AraC family transcriptional regulator
MNTKIEVKTMPVINVAYVKHVGDFTKIGNSYGKLMGWAGPKGLIVGKTITVYHDDPNITDISKVRQSACIELKKPIKTSGEVNSTIIKEGKYAVGKFEISFSEFEKAWASMMIWVEENNYKVNNKRGSYEIYHNNFNNHPQKKCVIEICVPVS